jgi:hypothetical protein
MVDNKPLCRYYPGMNTTTTTTNRQSPKRFPANGDRVRLIVPAFEFVRGQEGTLELELEGDGDSCWYVIFDEGGRLGVGLEDVELI